MTLPEKLSSYKLMHHSVLRFSIVHFCAQALSSSAMMNSHGVSVNSRVEILTTSDLGRLDT